MVSPSAPPASRYRRRILGIGVLLVGALYVVGAPIFVDRIEDDLDQRVPAELDAAGYEGITASFSGQDGTLTCRVPLEDPERARAAAYAVWGVRAIELDRSCRVNQAPAAAEASLDATEPTEPEETDEDADPAPGTTTPSTESESDLATVDDIVTAHPDLAFLSVLLDDVDIGRSDGQVTLFAPSNAAFDAVPSDILGQLQNDQDLLAEMLTHHAVDGAWPSSELRSGELTALDGNMLTVDVGDDITVGGATIVDADIVASNGVVHVVDSVIMAPVDEPSESASVNVTYDGESVTLSGVAAGEAERDALVQAANDAVGESSVDDALAVDADTGIDQPTADALAALIAAMPDALLSGEAGFDGSTLFATGVVASESGSDAFTAVSAFVGVDPVLTEPSAATDGEAAELEAQLNEFVAENPILFEPSSDVLDESAFAVIDRIAQDALQFAGVSITVEGHTDSDGVAIENLQLSRNRATAVEAALIERGLTDVESVGFGSEQPVLVDGVEDKAASRRVEFRVVSTS